MGLFSFTGIIKVSGVGAVRTARITQRLRTAVSCHVTVDFKGVSNLHGIDPVFPVSFGITRVPDVFA